MGHLHAIIRHRITSVVEGQVHVLSEKRHKVDTIEPTVDSLILDDFLPDLTLLAGGRLGQILGCVELGDVGEGAWVQVALCKLLGSHQGLDL